MFGTDLHGLSVNYAHDVGFEILDGAHPSEEEREWIDWRTADTVYQLGLANRSLGTHRHGRSGFR